MLTRRAIVMAGLVINAGYGRYLHAAQPLSSPETKPITDQTGELQAALDRGGHVALLPNSRYLVSAPVGARAALYIDDNTSLDLAGSTLELAPNQRCSLIAQKPGKRVSGVTIANGSINGNGPSQPGDYRADVGITPTVYLMNCDQLTLRELTINDAYMYAIYAQGSDGVIDKVVVRDAIGGGIHVTGSHWKIDAIDVRNVSFFERVNCQGNPFIVSLTHSSIGSVRCENFGFGVKFQNGCEDLDIGSIEAVGGSNNADFLIKIQGAQGRVGNKRNSNIRIGRIAASKGPMSGLYVYASDDVDIGYYSGTSNGLSHPSDHKNSSDILIIDSGEIHFGEIQIKDFNRHALWLHDRTGRVVASNTVMTSDTASQKDAVVIRGGAACLNGNKCLVAGVR